MTMSDDEMIRLSADQVLAELLRLGQRLHQYAFPRGDLGLTRTIRPVEAERLQAEIAEIQKRIEAAAADRSRRDLRSCLDAIRDHVPDSMLIKIVSYVAWHSIACDPMAPSVTKVCNAAGMGDVEGMLQARRVIRRLVGKGDILVYKDDGFPGGDMLPGWKLNRLMTGAGNLSAFWTAETLKNEKEQAERQGGNAAARCPSHMPDAPAKTKELQTSSAPVSPRQIFDALRRSVIGMDEVVQRYAVQMSIHMRRVAILKAGGTPTIPQVCVLLAGPSGCGKTMLAETCGQLLGVPFCVGNMAEVSSEAYVGPSVSDLFLGFFRKGVTVADVQSGGILLCDEMDKRRLNATGGGPDVLGAGPQGELLRILESSGASKIQLGGRRSNDAVRGFLDPFGMAFVLAGAFSGIDEVIRNRRRTKGGMGFSGEGDHAQTSPDMREFLLNWFMPELLNRVGSVIVIPPRTHSQLVEIATAPGGIINRQNEFLSSLGISLRPSAEAIKEIAGFCLANKTYARGMRSLLLQLAETAIYEERQGDLAIGVEDVRRVIEGLRNEPEGLVS